MKSMHTSENAFRIVAENRIISALFLRRINRFLVECDLNGSRVKAFLPNPGRLWELLFPGTPVMLSRDVLSRKRSTEYTLVGTTRNGTSIMLHTHAANDAVRWLLDNGKIPSLSDHRVIRQEYPVEGSRFDFLLQKDGQKVLLEVKSCSLFGRKIAMFPDAPSQRAVRHVRELGNLGRDGNRVVVLFLVQSPEPDYFLPEYHTDPDFAEALYKNRHAVEIIPLSVSWNSDLELSENIRELELPWHIYEEESGDRGCYMVILRLDENRKIKIGALGDIFFRKGFYIYVGSARKNLRTRMERHKRKRKKLHWHIDYLIQSAQVVTTVPVRTAEDLECELAKKIWTLSHWSVPGFGCSDCNCISHLFGMSSSPFEYRDFIKELIDLRINRLEKYI